MRLGSIGRLARFEGLGSGADYINQTDRDETQTDRNPIAQIARQPFRQISGSAVRAAKWRRRVTMRRVK